MLHLLMRGDVMSCLHLAKQLLIMFANMMYSVRFYFINTAIIYEFSALLKFTYIMHADLFRQFLHCAF